jgi:hypothetical protein
MSQVLDYSAGFPGAAAIHAAGYIGAVRYIGFPERRKCTTAGELADFTAHRIGMALVYENTVTTWRGGTAAGMLSAATARGHADAIGFPAARPIYFAVDQDVVASGEFGVMLDYLRGCGKYLGGSGRVGVYGEADVIDRARDAGVARYFWQTAAWSRGRRTPAHLFQHVGAVHVGGVACDVNDVLADDWGQHHLVATLKEADMPLTPDDGNVPWAAVDPEAVNPDGSPHVEKMPVADWIALSAYRTARIQAEQKRQAAVQGQILAAVTAGGVDESTVKAALKAAVEESMAGVVVPALRAAIPDIEDATIARIRDLLASPAGV